VNRREMATVGSICTASRIRRTLLGLTLTVLAMLGASGNALAALSFSTAPALPTLPAVTLNGHQQTTTTAMTNFAITEIR
jgi:hypothetical protein